MAENIDAGTLSYTVTADTSGLLEAAKQTADNTKRMADSLESMGKASASTTPKLTQTASAVRNLGTEAGYAEKSVGGLVKLLGSMIAVQGIGGIIGMAEGYNEMAERIRQATSSAAEYEMAQARLLAGANRTYRSLSEAQEMFINVSGSLKNMGYSAEQSLDVTDSLSLAFVKSATSADRAKIAMGAFSRSLSKGRVDSDAWEMMLISVPSLADDMSASIGRSAQEIRKMGAEGKLTTRDLTEGLLGALEKNGEAADEMATTVADAFTNLRNSLTVYIGEANQASGATSLISSAIVSLGENIDLVVKSLMFLGAGALAKYVASQGLATMASVKQALAARQEAAAALQTAQTRNTAALAALAHARANVGLTTSTTALAAAEKAAAVAATGLATAQKAASAASVGMLGILGGPAGVIAIVASVAAGFLLMGNNADAAVKDVDELTGSLDKLNQKQLELRKHDLEKAIDENRKALEDTSISVNALRKDYEDLHAQLGRGVSDDDLKNLTHTITEQEVELTKLADKHSRLETALINVNAAIQQADASQRSFNQAMDDSPTDDYLKRLVDRKNAYIDGNSAVKQTERYIKALNNVTPERIDQLRKEAAEVDKLAAAQRRQTKGAGAGSKGPTDAERGAKQNAETLRKLAESIALAHLEGEQLAVVQGRLSLNEYATPEQIASAEQLASALYRVNEQKKLQDKVGEDPSKYIRGNVEPLAGGEFDQQDARYAAEVEKEEQRYADQLVRLREAMEAQKLTQEQYNAEFEAMQEQHANRLNQIDQARTSLMLSSTRGALDDMTSALGSAFGEQSGIYKAAFAASKAFAIAESIIKIQQGIAAAAALPFPANIPAMASVAAATANIVSSIQSVTMAGGRRYGGPVNPGKMYQVNETGQPEVFNAGGGKQYFIPNSRGQVIPSDQVGGMGQAPIVNVVVNGVRPDQSASVSQGVTDDKQAFVEVMLNDIETNGPITQAGRNKLGWAYRPGY